MYTNREIGQRLKRIREDDGLTQEYLAEILAIPVQEYANYEEGEIAPLPKDSAEFLGMVDNAKEVDLAIKKFLGSFTTMQFRKAESYKNEVK